MITVMVQVVSIIHIARLTLTMLLLHVYTTGAIFHFINERLIHRPLHVLNQNQKVYYRVFHLHKMYKKKTNHKWFS